MWSHCNLNTAYSFFSDKEIRDMATHPDNPHAHIEFVRRYFNSSWFYPFATEEQTMAICENELKKFPQHNLFNYAYAQLEKNAELKNNYLKAAAKSCLPCNVSFSAQAAYELGSNFYPVKRNAYGQCLAWLSKAIILSSSEACDNFCKNIFYEKSHSLISLHVIFLTTSLSGKTIPGFANSKIVEDFTKGNNRLPHDMSHFINAYAYPITDNTLQNADSPIKKIAEKLVSLCQAGFVAYFDYCYQNEIISEDTFLHLIRFYLNSGYTDKNDLRRGAIDVLIKHNLPHKLNSNLTLSTTTGIPYYLPTNYAQPNIDTSFEPSAPPETSTGSYYYMYSSAPEMMQPANTTPLMHQDEPALHSLVPVYIPHRTAVTAAPNQEPHNTEKSLAGMNLYYGYRYRGNY